MNISNRPEWLQLTIDLSPVASLLIAIGVGVYMARRARRAEKIQYTIDLLQFKFANVKIFAAYHYVSKLMLEGKLFMPETLFDDPVELDKQILEVDRLLSYFELISIAYLSGDVDRKTIEMQIKTGLYKTYDTCEPYIRDMQQRLNKPKLYENLKTVADQFRIS